MDDISETLIQGLATSSLSYLIPKQDVAPLIGSASIQMCDNDLIDKNPQLPINQMRTALNEDPGYFKEVIEFLVDDFRLDDPELDDIRFKRPIFDVKSDQSPTQSYDLNMPYFESRLFEAIDDIKPGSIVFSDVQLTNKTSLNVPTCNPDTDIIQKQEVNSNKRQLPLSDVTEPPSKNMKIEPSSDAIRSTITNIDELKEESSQVFVQLMNMIGMTDDEIDIDSNELWLRLNGEHPVLSEFILMRIDQCLSRILRSDAVQSMDLNYFLRIENICFRNIQYCSDYGISFTSSLSEENQSELAFKIRLSVIGLISCLIILNIFNGGRDDKRLFLDTYLSSVVEFLANTIEGLLIPSAKLIVNNPKFTYNLKPLFSNVLGCTCSALGLLTTYLIENEIDDSIITKLEYLATSVIFSELNLKEKTSIVGVSYLEILKGSACDTIVILFKFKQDQRQFLLDEIVGNLEKLPTQRTAARQLKLARGINVQLVTSLLLRMLQVFDISSYFIEKKKKSLNNVDPISADVQRDEVSTLALKTYQEITDTANAISSLLLSIFSNNPDSAHKSLFEILVEDLLNLLVFPEWPGASILIATITKTLMFVIESGTYTSPVETFSLELIGSIGVKMVSLKNVSDERGRVYSDINEDNLPLLASDYESVLEFLQSNSSRDVKSRQSFNFLILQFLNVLAEKKRLLALHSHDTDPIEGKDKELMDSLAGVFDRFSGLAEEGAFLNLPVDPSRDSSSIFTYSSIIFSQDLFQLYDAFLSLLVRSLDHSKVKSRSRAIKNLSLLVSKEPSLLTSPEVRRSISSRLNDSSPLVRDAVIDLLSQYIITKPEVIDQFYQPICERIQDNSLQVRKRVIKLAKEMYLSSDKKEIKGLIAEKLLRRIYDEDDAVSELVTSYLIELWFLKSEESQISSPNVESIGSRSLKSIEVIIDVIGRSDKNLDFFENFFNDFVLNKNEKNQKFHGVIMDSIREIVERSLSFIIECSGGEYQSQVERAMGLLSIFAKCDGKLTNQDQLTYLQPYLINEETTGDIVCLYTLRIFRYSLPECVSLRPNFIDSAQKSLLRRLTKFNVKELNEAVPCVWYLSSLKKDTSKITTASLSCLKMIKPFVDQLKQSKEIQMDAKLQRLLYLIGNFGKYCDFEDRKEIFMNGSVGMRSNETVISLITKFLLYFCNDTADSQIRRTALRNVINVCITHPKLLISETVLKIIDKEFASNDMESKNMIIQGIIEFLEKEEKDSIKRNGVQVKSSRSTKLDVAVFHGKSSMYVNDGICASVVQRYTQQVLDLCLYDDGTFSYLPVKFLQSMVHLGFSNPKICIPTIIALEASPTGSIRRLAVEIHSSLAEKHESLIEGSYVEGVKLATKFRSKVSKNLFGERNLMVSFYSILKDTKLSKRRFFLSLVKSFSVPYYSESLSELLESKSFFFYLFLNLSSVSLSTLEEVYILVRGIDQILEKEGLDLSYLIPSKEMDKATSKEEWIRLGTASQVLLAFIEFRKHLFLVYNLSEEKAEDFQLSKVDKELRSATKPTQSSLLEFSDLQLTLNDTKSCQSICQNFVSELAIINGE